MAVRKQNDNLLALEHSFSKAESKALESNSYQLRGFQSALLAVLLVNVGSLVAAGSLVVVALLYVRAAIFLKNIHASWYVQNFSYAFLIALANNVDNLGARIAYSIQGTKVSTPINLWISVITFVISFGAAYLGTQVTGSFGAEAASVIAMVLLVGLGALMILGASKPAWYEDDPSEKGSASLWTVFLKPHYADVDASKHIDFKEGTVLGIALSINNIGGGLSAGIIGVTPLLVGFLSAVVSFVALWAGNYVAEFFVRRGIANKAAVVGGLLLIIIGIKQVF